MHGPFAVPVDCPEAQEALRAQGRLHALTRKVYSEGGWLTNVKCVRVEKTAKLSALRASWMYIVRRTVGMLNPQFRSEGSLHCCGHPPIKRQANGPLV